MKLYVKSSKYDTAVDIIFDVYLPIRSDNKIAATDLSDLPVTRAEADPLALENFDTFVESVEEIFEHYGFDSRKSRSSEFSTYHYYAHECQIEAGSVPKYVHVRISSHPVSHKSQKHLQELKKQRLVDLEEIKLPEDKLKQRYKPLKITADRNEFDTYEDVLNYAELRVRELFDELNLSVDLSDYDKIGPF